MREDAAPNYLFVDEDPLQLSALRRLLRDIPGSKRSATSGEEALRLADQQAPSVVISSYHLPDTDGLSLLATLRQRTPDLTCALHTTQSPERMRLQPGITLLLKPCPPEQLKVFLLSAGACRTE
jgi:CheY-like chemotaxis protein